MRTPVILTLLLFFISCSQGTEKQKTQSTKYNLDLGEEVVVTDSGTSTVTKVNQPPSTKEYFAVTTTLQKQYGNKYRVLNDELASWMKDAFDYFIVPERKQNPHYPYIATGDFDSDGKADTAALITDSLKTNYQVAFLMGNFKNFLWEEDIIEDAAIKTLSRPGPIQGMDEKNIEKTRTVRPKGDVLEVEYFERAAFVLYWDKKSFRRIRTAD